MTRSEVSTRMAFPPDGSSNNSVAEREKAGRRRRRKVGLVSMMVPSLLTPANTQMSGQSNLIRLSHSGTFISHQHANHCVICHAPFYRTMS